MASLDLSTSGIAKLLTFAREISVEAGAQLVKAFQNPVQDYDRKSATDPVTVTDRAIEKLLFSRVRSKFFSHSFIGEESACDQEWTQNATWIIDPIDGTANCTDFKIHCLSLNSSPFFLYFFCTCLFLY